MFVQRLENPYAYEIDQFECETNEEKLSKELDSPKLPGSLESSEFKYIDTVGDLQWLCDHLGKANRGRVKEIAVDLEHHSYRSFQGFTCLMQISTRTHDFVVDTIKLRADMHRLNEIFTDWTLTKVNWIFPFNLNYLNTSFGLPRTLCGLN